MSKRKRDDSMSATGQAASSLLQLQADAPMESSATFPTISRKITACTACRKQKVWKEKSSRRNHGDV